MANEPNIPDDVAYSIITGYYPEIASRVQYGGKKKGRGQIGAKFARKRGFTETSVQREEVSMMDEATKAALEFRGPTVPMTSGAEIVLKNIGYDAETEKFKYKFMGGSEQYQLWGDQVWYMAGIRDKKDMITQFLEDSNMTGLQYQKVYTNTESDLAQEAVAFAKRMFDNSWDIAEIQEHFEDVSVESPEEIGYKDGEFEWKTVDQLPDDVKVKSEFSKARNRDIVKYNVETNTIEAIYDVTEQSIEKVGQHGLATKPPKELVDAIKDIKKGGGVDKKLLKEQVIKMYESNIDEYNSHIKGLKHIAGLGHNVKKVKNPWDKVLKAVSPKKSGKAGTPDLARALGIKMSKFHFMDTAKKSADQTSIEFIAHMLGTLTKETNANFEQSHRVATKPDGSKVYASVPMVTSPQTLFFLKGPLKGTAIVEGFSYTSAMRYKGHNNSMVKSANMSRSQKHAFTKSKIGANTAIKGTNATLAHAQMNLRSGFAPSTAVNIPSGPEMTKFLNTVLNGAVPDLMKIMKNSKELQEIRYSHGGSRKEKKLGKGGDVNKSMFWALPYIGVMQSEYIEEKTKK